MGCTTHDLEHRVIFKKALFIIPCNGHGGCEYSALTIGKFMVRELGVSVSFCFPDAPSTRILVALAEDNGMRFVDFGIIVDEDDSDAIFKRHRERTREILAAEAPDIVFISFPWPSRGLGMAAACADLKIPALVKFALVPALPFGLQPGVRFAVRAARDMLQFWFATSRSGAEVVENSFGLEPGTVDHFHVAPLGLKALVPDSDPVKPAKQSRLCLRQKLGIPQDAFLMTTIARLSSQKGQHIYLEILPSLLKQIPNAHILWVGDGELRPSLERRAAVLGLSDRLTIAGFRPDVRPLLRVSDLFVFPTLNEGGTSQAILEAMEEGVPVIASRLPGIEEVLRDGIEGLLTEVGDPEDIERVVVKAANDEALRVSLVASARERVKRYSVPILIAETIARMDHLLGTQLRYARPLAALWKDPLLSSALGGPTPAGQGMERSLFAGSTIIELTKGGSFQQIEIEIRDLVAGSEIWPAVRLKFQRHAKGISIEFRSHASWPRFFETWPSKETDKWGSLAIFGSTEVVGFMTAHERPLRDIRLIAALVRLMPRIVERAFPYSDVPIGDRAGWVSAAEHFSGACLSPAASSPETVPLAFEADTWPDAPSAREMLA